MKRLISLMLTICLMAFLLPAEANSVRRIRPGEQAESVSAETATPEPEEEPYILGDIPGAGYSFDFTVRLHPEAMSKGLQERMEGYADLLAALRFEGTYSWALNGESFELELKIIPVNYSAGTVELWLHGSEDIIFVQSNLFGEKSISLDNYSLLAFCAKMSEHLGIPLHYLALLYPYSWKFALKIPLADFAYMVDHMDEHGVISAELARYFAHDCLVHRINENEPLQGLINALSKDTDVEESFRAFVSEIPAYLLDDVTENQEIYVLQEENSTTWRAACGEVYRETRSEQGDSIEVNLPWMKIGYRPVFSWDSIRENQSLSGHLQTQILGGENQGQDLVNLEASLVAFPTSWPTDAWSLLSLSLTGGLLPNIGLTCYLNAEENGHTRLEFRKPTVNYEPGAMVLSVEGNLLPIEGEVPVREFGLEDREGALSLLVANDAEIMSYLPDMIQPMMEGMMQFLVGIPTSACQAVMDDLTDLGVFQVLIGD